MTSSSTRPSRTASAISQARTEEILNWFEDRESEQRQRVDRVLPAPPEEEPSHCGTLFSSFSSDKIETMTNFSPTAFLQLYEWVLNEENAGGRRGSPPRIQLIDALFLTLIYYKRGEPFSTLATLFNRSVSSVERAVCRVRPLLNRISDLHFTVVQSRRPTSPDSDEFKSVGLIVDSTSCEVFRPHGRFHEAMALWDAKNHIYAVKKEVAIKSTPPYTAVFVKNYENGSVHDKTIFEKNFELYSSFLTKKTGELDENTPAWSIMVDKGYIGADTDPIPLVHPTKKPQNGFLLSRERDRNRRVGALRVWVECWFGRLKSAWKIFGSVYRNSLEFFDSDFNNCAYLTNLLISATALKTEEGTFYKKLITLTREWSSEKKKKRLDNQKGYRERKKKRLNNILEGKDEWEGLEMYDPYTRRTEAPLGPSQSSQTTLSDQEDGDATDVDL